MAGESQSNNQRQIVLDGGGLRRILLLPSLVIMVIGSTAGPLFSHIYFLHGGAQLWLTSLLQSCGFPILFFPLCLSYVHQKGRPGEEGVFSMMRPAAAACVALGFLSGLDNYMYSYGSASLPLSTSSLLISTLVAFTAAFSFLIVRPRFTGYSVNAVVLLVMGPVLPGLQANGDRPSGESRRRYYLGFFAMLGAAALYGMPLIQLTSTLSMERKVAHVLGLEVQVIMAVSATTFCVVGMLMNKDFQVIPAEAKEFGLGETKYYLVLAACAILWQLMNLGFVGVIFCSSSLLSSIVNAMSVPLGEILSVLVLHEKFTGGKGFAMGLSIWGLVSYLYGEYLQQHRRQRPMADPGLELPTSPRRRNHLRWSFLLTDASNPVENSYVDLLE